MADETKRPASLAEALSVLQARLPEVHKAQTATVPTKAGGSYRYTYAGLPDISRALLPLLGELGLAWTCRPTLNTEGRFVLAYALLHTSGDQLSGEYPLPAGGSPQEIGSAVTYGRRYALCAVTGLAADDDDDGRAASAERAVAAARPARRRTARGGSDETPDERSPELLSDGHRRAIMAGFAELGVVDRETRLNITRKLAGVPDLESTSQLTAEQARAVLDGIAQRKAQQAEPAA